MKKSDLPVGRILNNYIKFLTDGKFIGVKISGNEER